MSRCFPFPPPGYIGFKASDHDALIESIKLQRECEKAKAERKKEESEKAKPERKKEESEKAKAERKKEKEEKKRKKKEKRERKEKRKAEKEKKKEEKEKAKQYPYGAQDSKAHKIGAPDGEAQKSLADCKQFSKEKTIADMDEQMERSDLTEEHQQPVSVPKRSSSSDSTENSNKRKRSASPSRNGGISGHGNVIRIRLGKNKEPKVAKEPICSTSGRTESAAPLRKDPPVQGHRIGDKKQICSTSGANQVFTPVDVPKPSVLTAFEKEMQAASLLYNKLVGSLALPVIPATYSEALDLDDDQEWLFGRKKQIERQVEKRQKPNSDIPCRSSSLLQPCAQFLPDVGIYALPYTLPF